MKGHVTKVDERLHAEFKKAARMGVTRLTLNELSEVGMLLVLAERNLVATREGALILGATERAAAVFGRIVGGEEW